MTSNKKACLWFISAVFPAILIGVFAGVQYSAHTYKPAETPSVNTAGRYHFFQYHGGILRCDSANGDWIVFTIDGRQTSITGPIVSMKTPPVSAAEFLDAK